MQDFSSFFRTATGHSMPHPYQNHLACGLQDSTENGGANCRSRLISVPTGMGKTSAVTLAWLWNRVWLRQPEWPRRLVYCLPMRTLVEQTRDEITHWLKNLSLANPDQAELAWLAQHSPIVLMGGVDNDSARRNWDIYPEKPAIIIGTQDMLLSRALNRGYGMARARWPMHFALLNNDCLWVMDEVQLMSVGLATSAQLQSFRDQCAHTWWMSATLQPQWLQSPETETMLPELETNILRCPAPSGIVKHLELRENNDDALVANIVQESMTAGETPGTVLVILNTVGRATKFYRKLTANKSLIKSTDVHLAHSRFRPQDRQVWRQTFLKRTTSLQRSRIIVATQIVEAGVDISADLLITELAPWSNLIQRFGRAARYGGTARVYILDLDEKQAAPYDYEELTAAREELKQLRDVSIESLLQHDAALSPARRSALYPYSPNFLLLEREIKELFDTSPDLSGADVDVSRFIRTDDERDCQIAWIEGSPTPDFHPSTNELCPVPIGEAKAFVKKCKKPVWRWDYLEREWQKIRAEQIYPGLILLTHVADGGYTPERGFDAASKSAVPVLEPVPPVLTVAADSAEEDESLSEASWQTILEHGQATSRMLLSFELKTIAAEVLELAARWHDLGKAHAAFQSLLIDAPQTGIAKAPRDAWRRPPVYRISETDLRPGFRHELASALALLALRETQPWLSSLSRLQFDLLLYLTAAHHGKVRASMQASPHDQNHPVAQAGADMPIRGVMEGDVIEGRVLDLPDMTLSLEPATIGWSLKTGASWSERVNNLLVIYGPFRLALFETLLRAADIRASLAGTDQ